MNVAVLGDSVCVCVLVLCFRRVVLFPLSISYALRTLNNTRIRSGVGNHRKWLQMNFEIVEKRLPGVTEQFMRHWERCKTFPSDSEGKVRLIQFL